MRRCIHRITVSSRWFVGFVATCALIYFPGCESKPGAGVRTLEPFMRPERMVRQYEGISAVLVRQRADDSSKGQIEVMVTYGAVLEALESLPGQRRRVPWSWRKQEDAYDVKLSEKELLRPNRERPDGPQPENLRPFSFLIDPAKRTLTPTDPASWLSEAESGASASAKSAAAPPVACASWQENWMIEDSSEPAWAIPLAPNRGENWSIDRSGRFLARVAKGSSLAEVRDPVREFRRGPWGLWLIIYDRKTGREVAEPVELVTGVRGLPRVHGAFTHDSQWLVLVAGSPWEEIWVIPTGLPRPEEPWVPKGPDGDKPLPMHPIRAPRPG